MNFRKKFFVFFVFFTAALCQSVFAEDSDYAKETMERRQQTEIDGFLYGYTKDIPTMTLSIQFFNDAVKFFEKNEFDLSREALQQAIELEPRNSLAFELLGDIENLHQKFDLAEHYYKKSYLVSASSRIKDKIGKLQKERSVEDNFDTDEDELFLIKYRRGEQSYDSSELKGFLRDAYRQVSQDFSFYFNHKTTVLFYTGEQFHEVTGKEKWVTGLYDGKIRLPAYKQTFNRKDLQAVIVHELTHAFVTALSAGRAPVWLQEGLAQYEQNKVVPIDTIVFDSAVRINGLLSFNRLFFDKFDGEKVTPLEISLFYQESYRFVRYLIERYKMYYIKELLGKIKDEKTIDQAIEESFLISVSQLEKEWLAALK